MPWTRKHALRAAYTPRAGTQTSEHAEVESTTDVLTNEDISKVAGFVLEAVDLDGREAISFAEFERVCGRDALPDFENKFCVPIDY